GSVTIELRLWVSTPVTWSDFSSSCETSGALTAWAAWEPKTVCDETEGAPVLAVAPTVLAALVPGVVPVPGGLRPPVGAAPVVGAAPAAAAGAPRLGSPRLG